MCYSYHINYISLFILKRLLSLVSGNGCICKVVPILPLVIVVSSYDSAEKQAFAVADFNLCKWVDYKWFDFTTG